MLERAKNANHLRTDGILFSSILLHKFENAILKLQHFCLCLQLNFIQTDSANGFAGGNVQTLINCSDHGGITGQALGREGVIH